MRVILTCCLLIIYQSNICSQVFPSEVSWYYCNSSIWPSNANSCSVERLENFRKLNDTLYADNIQFSTYNHLIYTSEVKQIGRKLWMDDELLYNFNLGQGEKLILLQDTFTIDSVKLLSFLGKKRTIQYGSFRSLTLAMVEGIGSFVLFGDDGDFEFSTYNFRPSDAILFLTVDPSPSLLFLYENGQNILNRDSTNCEPCLKLVHNSEKPIDEIKFFPQPFKDFITISGLTNGLFLEVYESNGRLITKEKIEDNIHHFDGGHLSAGVYFFIINDQQGKRKILKKAVKI